MGIGGEVELREFAWVSGGMQDAAAGCFWLAAIWTRIRE